MKGNVCWGQVHLELLNEAKSKGPEVNLAVDNKISLSNNKPNGTCFSLFTKGYYNKKPCHFLHIKKPQVGTSFRQPFHASANQPFRAPGNQPFQAPGNQLFRFAGPSSSRPLSSQHGYRRPFKKITHPY